MQYTNEKGLPAIIVDALTINDEHRQADYSATGLLKEPCQHYLLKAHPNTEKDVADSLNILWGKAVHAIFEKYAKANKTRYESELYMTAEVAGRTISGTCDLVDTQTNTVLDFKTVSVYSIKDPASHMADWTAQLNVYAYLLQSGGNEWVKALKIIAIARDWRRSESLRDAEYPPEVMEIDIPVWGIEKTREFIAERVKLLDNATDDAPCSPEFRWADNRCWAVEKKGRKTAVKLHSSQAEAEAHAKSLGSDHYVAKRENSQWKRCAGYCDVAQHCKHYQNHLKQGVEE